MQTRQDATSHISSETHEFESQGLKAFTVGVIVVNYNSGAWLGRCMKSLFAQSRPPERIIVVDNDSEDNSLDALSELESGQESPTLEVIRAKSNLGFAAANNLAIEKLSDVQWVALLNPDAEADSGWLEALLRAADERAEYSFFGSRMLDAQNPDRLDGTGDVYHASGLVWRAGHGRAERSSDAQACEIFSPCAAAALYRRGDFLDAGGFDERYFCYSEDIDLGFRLRLAGLRCLYVPDSIVAHAGSGITGAISEFTVYHGHRNLVWTYIKNMPGRLVWLYLPQHLLVNLVSIFWLTLRGRGGAVVRAKIDAIKGLGWVLKERKRIQSERKASVDDIRSMLSRNPLKPYFSRQS